MSNQALNLKAAMVSRLGEFHGLPEADGLIHRFHVEGDKPGSRNGWYVFTLDERVFACYGSWKTGEKWIFSERLDQYDAKAELKASTRRHKAVREAQALAHAQAKREALQIWSTGVDANPFHPYLYRKGCSAYGLRQSGAQLLIPMFVGRELVNLQRINPDGRKYFLKGGRVAGAYHLIPGHRLLPDAIYLCEGWATGASIALMTGGWVACAFNAGNLLAAARNLKREYPDITLIIAGDDDRKSLRNTGREAATAAADAMGCELIFPLWPSDAPLDLSDFNDLYIWQEGWK